jgi:hypothetical protein
MLPCFRCGAPAVGYNGVCANCGMRAFESPYVTPRAGYRPRRSIRGLGLALMIALGLTAVEFLVVVGAQARRNQIVSRILDSLNGNGDGPDLSSVQSSDDLARTTAILALVAFLTCAVLMICWLYIARTNAETYSPFVFQLSRGWAIGAWFVPVGALFLPLMVALDTHRGTIAGRTPGRKPSGGAITGWWWGFWLVGYMFLLGAFGAGGSKGDDLADPLRNLHEMQTTSRDVEPAFVLLAVAAVLLLLYVRKITGIQTARAGEPFGGGMPMAHGMPGYGVAAQYGPVPYGPSGQYGPPPGQQYGPAPYGPEYGQAPYGPGYGPGQAPYGPGPGQAPYGMPPQPYAAEPQLDRTRADPQADRIQPPQ